ncbi:MAG: response regulator [Oscillospiraceae bacterium]|nr:response regulator [Oscillospiraceae bacterium]
MASWIIVVDDDTANLKMAGFILSKAQMRVTALQSGQALLDYIKKHEAPDLILLDILMPGMDGFETLRRLRQQETETGREETPVVFLTADENTDTESHGFEVGVADYIRKPFNPEVLLRRIDNILSKQERMRSLRSEATTDKLTGFLNKAAAAEEIGRDCKNRSGCLLMIDLDSFKHVNDIYGHDMGDKVLISFAEIISAAVPPGSRCGRIGGDEFVAFCAGITDMEEQTIARLTERLNDELVARAKELMGSQMAIPLGASVGAVFVPQQGESYPELIKLADQALYTVKQNGKHGYAIFRRDLSHEDPASAKEMDLRSLSSIIGERRIPNVALQLDQDAFSYVYRYIMRYIIRNQRTACKALLTLTPADGVDERTFKQLCTDFGTHVRESLRKSDIIMRSQPNQYFVFLTDIRENYIEKVIGETLIHTWKEKNGEDLIVTYETEFIGSDSWMSIESVQDKVVIVDDDPANLNIAGRVLSKGGMYVTALRSGKALLNYLEDNLPDLILLDVKMPDLDGFETLHKIHSLAGAAAQIPVIFLTADEEEGKEKEGLSLGAMDYIRKPFVPEVLLLRVRHCLELVKLQKKLSSEVERKTRENKDLMIDVVRSLADAIDAKDTYTNGHSDRVAEYAREIARRAGYSQREQEEVYIMGLLHDVGKIGIPDAVINKPAKLTEEEFAVIRRHPVLGAKILENIKAMPALATAAHWHHERFDGTGYPDGLAGEDIPETARIISVADAYDAMTSFRSYREPLRQEVVRLEFERNTGTQFDPRFASIMLAMIEEDTEFTMREHSHEKD